MLKLGRNSIHIWQAEFGGFEQALKAFADAKLNSFNAAYSFDTKRLEMIHQQWRLDCDDLLKTGFSKSVEELSDVKMMALLVAVMASYRFIRVFEGNKTDDTPEKEEERKDFLKNCELVLAFDFALSVVDWFEENGPRNKNGEHPTGFNIPLSVRNDLFRTIESNKEDRKTVVCAIFSALYRRT